MLLFEETKSTFIHIPKAGGTSLRRFGHTSCNERSRRPVSKLARRLPVNRDRWPWLNLDARTHMSYMRMKASGFPDEVLNDYSICCSARFPLSWHFSTYRHFLRHHTKGGYANQFDEGIMESFESYLRHRIDLGPVPQLFMLTDTGGSIHCDFYMRLEEIDNDLTELINILGSANGVFPKLNRDTTQAPMQWSEGLKALCYDAYRDDYEMFGYDRDGNLLPKKKINGASISSESKEILKNIDPSQFDPWEVCSLR